MSDHPPSDERPRRATRGDRQQHAVLATSGLAIYLGTLWFGVTVVGDTVPRSSLMAGLIVILSGMAYITTRAKSVPPDQ
jgi:hypothetical protein